MMRTVSRARSPVKTCTTCVHTAGTAPAHSVATQGGMQLQTWAIVESVNGLGMQKLAVSKARSPVKTCTTWIVNDLAGPCNPFPPVSTSTASAHSGGLGDRDCDVLLRVRLQVPIAHRQQGPIAGEDLHHLGACQQDGGSQGQGDADCQAHAHGSRMLGLLYMTSPHLVCRPARRRRSAVS